MATVSETLRIATSWLGYTETGDNITVFWKRLKPAFQGSPWCMAFVVDVLAQQGDRTLLDCDLPFYCPAQEQMAKKQGRWSTTGRPGDVIIFGTTTAVHTGFLERDLGGGYIQTIEGNTSSGSGGSQTNGGGVYRRVRPTSWVRGYIRPNYGSSRPAAGEQIPVTGRIDVPTARATQLWLNAFDANKKSDIPVDGSWGPMTEKKLQWMIGAAQDGQHGPETQRKLESMLGLTPSGASGWTKQSITTLQLMLNDAIAKGKI